MNDTEQSTIAPPINRPINRQSLRQTLRQTFAITRSECLRMATSPAWAILLFLWTLVCGLFFQIVINYAAANALPVGETPMSYFFRTAPFLLPLLLIVFVPQLTMDVVAGRRERGRMEHLLISGMHPGALIAGAFIAILGLLFLLLIPPLLFHGIVAMHASPDFGKTCSALASLFFIGASIAALGLAVSCWSPNRLAASLIAVSIGMAWWIIDVFGQQIDQAGNWETWRASLAMAMTIYDSASGLLEPRILVGFIFITVCLLYIARCGLDWQRFPRARACSALLAICIGFACMCHLQSWRSHWDMTSYQTHSIRPETRALTRSLLDNGGVQVTLASTPSMRGDPIDGPIYERCRHLMQRLADDGLVFNEMDPALDPNGAMQLTKECGLLAKDWEHPLLIVRHLDKFSVLRGNQLAVYQQQQKTLSLSAIRCEGAFINALNYLKDGRHQEIAWLQNAAARPIKATMLHQRNQSMQAAAQRLASDGYRVRIVKSVTDVTQNTQESSLLSATVDKPDNKGNAAMLTDKQDKPAADSEQQAPDMLIIAGPQKDLASSEINYLHSLLRGGTSLWILFDADESLPQLPNLQTFLQDYGIGLGSGLVAKATSSTPAASSGAFSSPNSPSSPSSGSSGDSSSTGDTGAYQLSFPVFMQSDSEPFTILFNQQRGLANAPSLPLQVSPSSDSQYTSIGFFKLGTQFRSYSNQHTGEPLNSSFCMLAIAHSKNPALGTICVSASVDSFSDAYLSQESNNHILSIIARDLSHKQQLDSLPAKPVQAQRFLLSTAQRLILIWCVGIGLPFASAALGGFIAWRRRRVV